MGSGALSGPALCTQYNYDTIYSTNLNPNLNIIRNAGPDNAPDPKMGSGTTSWFGTVMS